VIQRRSRSMATGPAGSVILRISLAESNPAIWRIVHVPGRTTLHQLHRVIQVVFSWMDYHLYEFRVADESYQAPHEEAEGRDSTRVPLAALKPRAGDRFEYTYDFGDDWLHEIEVVDVSPLGDDEPFPQILGGERAGPLDDAGGIRQYQELLRLRASALRGEELSADDREWLEWLPKGFDPEEFSVASAQHSLILLSAWGCLDGKR
jgi:hypothetical protein